MYFAQVIYGNLEVVLARYGTLFGTLSTSRDITIDDLLF